MSRELNINEGGLRECTLLLFPIAVVSFSNCFFLFIEKLLLARLSVEALELAVSANYVINVFQGPCIALAMMAQVFIARYHGANELHKIGPAIWQFIWFSILSLCFTVPGILIFSELYFQNSSLNDSFRPYLYSLTGINFLFPLTAALSCFYLGRGKTRILLWGTLGAQTAKLIFAYLFIFGYGVIPSFGVLGGVISTCLAQAGFCLLLLAFFINKKNQDLYCSYKWQFKPTQFWHYIQPGILRAFNRILNFSNWSAIAYLMVSKGDAYLLVMSVGGTYFMFLPFIGDALSQAQITIVSRFLGARKYHLLNRVFESGLWFLLISILLFAIPLLVFPEELYQYLFPNVQMSKENIISVSIGIWLSFAFYTFTMLPLSYIIAFKDMNFYLLTGILGWLNGFLFMYIAIYYFAIPAEHFWIVLSITHATLGLTYFLRFKFLQSKLTPAIA